MNSSPPTAPVSAASEQVWTTTEQYLNFVSRITNVYSLNSFKDRLFDAYRVNPLLDKPSYEAIWKQMHLKAKTLTASWNRYRRRFLLDD